MHTETLLCPVRPSCRSVQELAPALSRRIGTGERTRARFVVPMRGSVWHHARELQRDSGARALAVEARSV